MDGAIELAIPKALEEGRFGHHIKGSPRDGEWHCTCGYGEEEDHFDTAEEHIAKVVVEGLRVAAMRQLLLDIRNSNTFPMLRRSLQDRILGLLR